MKANRLYERLSGITSTSTIRILQTTASKQIIPNQSQNINIHLAVSGIDLDTEKDETLQGHAT